MFRISAFMKELTDPTPVLPRRSLPGPVVIWNLIRRCNLTCLHCYSISTDKEFAGELSHEEVLTVMQDLKAYGVPVLILSGGEPLLRPDILDIGRKAKDMGFYVGLSTNGTLIDHLVERDQKVKLPGIAAPRVADALEAPELQAIQARTGSATWRSVSSPRSSSSASTPLAHRIMPCDTPKRILRGARLATTITLRPAATTRRAIACSTPSGNSRPRSSSACCAARPAPPVSRVTGPTPPTARCCAAAS